MKKSIILIIISIISSYAKGAATADSLYLQGNLSINEGGSFKYNIILGPKNGKWQGYSILDPGGPNETRSSVFAHFSKERSAFIFSERALISSKSPVKTFCFVAGAAQPNSKKTELKGMFGGTDERKQPCGLGTVRFKMTEQVRPLLTPDGTKDTNLIIPLTKINKETFQAAGKQVTLEIWDRGVEDHDSIAVYLNDRLLVPAFEISAKKRNIVVDLQKGKNILKVRALNEGDEKPNSARIELSDQGNRLSLASFLKEGEEAQVEINY